MTMHSRPGCEVSGRPLAQTTGRRWEYFFLPGCRLNLRRWPCPGRKWGVRGEGSWLLEGWVGRAAKNMLLRTQVWGAESRAQGKRL